MNSLIKVFFNPRMAVILFLGFSSGIPLALTASTLQAWMTTENVDLKLIGIFALVGMPYALKFLWAPLFDRYLPCYPFKGLGRRRGWLFLIQCFLLASIALMGFSKPAEAPALVAFLAVCVSFFSASQDIVVDAYKTEILEQVEFGAGSGLFTLGYRIAMLISGAFALILADHVSWKMVYFIMACTIAVGLITTLFAKEPDLGDTRVRTLRDAVVLPFTDFFSRRGSIEVLIFILLYKLDVAMTLALMTPFLLTLGFTKTDIGAVTKVFGMLATVTGTLVGGGVMVKLGIHRALWVFGITQAISGLSFMILANVGQSYPMLVTAIAAENFFSGMGVAAFSAFMMSLCNRKFTATQYALLSSFMALTRYVASAPSGFLIESVGWSNYYLICTLAGIPGLLLLTRYRKWNLASNNA